MDFKLTQEQSVMRETARLFAAKSLTPSAEQYDDMGAPYPVGWMEQAGELGFMAMLAPAELGGIGAGTFDAGLVIEELAAGCAGMAAGVVSSLAGALSVLNSGASKRVVEQYIIEPHNRDAKSFRAGAAGLFETPFSVNPDGTTTGKEAGVLGIGRAEWFSVLTREGDGTSCWVVKPNMEGVNITPMANTLGLRAAGPARLKLDRVEGDRIGECSAEVVLALASTLLGCAAVGCARAALNNATQYARERYQGGDMIIKHDTVAHIILSNRARIDAARSRLWHVMRQNDALIDPATGAICGKLDVNASLLARVFAVEAALQATIDAVQCHGGYGYMHDYPVEKRMRDARSLGVVFGANPEILTHIKPSLME